MKKQEILNAYQWRYACKEFDSTKKMNQEEIDFLLEIIRLSPSSFGLQPFQVLVLRNKALLEDLAKIVWGGKKQLPTASEVLLFTIRKDIRHDDHFINHVLKTVRELPIEMLDIYTPLIRQHQEVDFTLLDDTRYLHDWAGKQVYIALGNVMSAAAEIGIDSCPIEGFTIAGVSELLAKHQVLDPALQEPCVFCAFGYRLTPPARAKTRRSTDDLIKIIE